MKKTPKKTSKKITSADLNKVSGGSSVGNGITDALNHMVNRDRGPRRPRTR